MRIKDLHTSGSYIFWLSKHERYFSCSVAFMDQALNREHRLQIQSLLVNNSATRLVNKMETVTLDLKQSIP